MFQSDNSEMKTIKPLPEGVRHSMRSGIIMFDMSRVVEELVFNSLDAGATKVHKIKFPLFSISSDFGILLIDNSIFRCLSSWVLFHALSKLWMMVSIASKSLLLPLC